MKESARKYIKNDHALKEKAKRRSKLFNNLRDGIFIFLSVFFMIIAPFVILSDFQLIDIIASCFGGFMIGCIIYYLIENRVEEIGNLYFKSYEIDIHDDVIRLVGEVTLSYSYIAYRDLLSVRPGYKIAEEAYKNFGCCMAAVPASKAELNAKREVEKLGFSVPTIG